MPTKRLSGSTLRTRRATNNEGDQAESNSHSPVSSALQGRAAVSRQKTLDAFIANTAPLPQSRVAVLWLCLLTGMLLSSKDLSIGARTARVIAGDLNTSAGRSLWIALVPSLVYASVCPIVAYLSNGIGRRNTVIISFCVLITFSAACGSASSFHSFMIMQIGQSVGGAGLYCMTMIVMPDVTPVGLIPFLPAVMGGTAVLGSVLGLTAGGLLAESGWWRCFFWINIPVAVLGAMMFRATSPEFTRGEELTRQNLSDLDWQGCLLMVAAFGFSLFGLQKAALESAAWSSMFASLPLAFGLICGMLLLLHHRTSKEKSTRHIVHVLPSRVATDPVLLAQFLSSLLAGYPYIIFTIMLPLRFEVVNFLKTSEIYSHTAPFTIAFAAGTSTCGLMLKHKRLASLRLWSAWLLTLVGTSLFVTVGADFNADAKMYVYMVIAGLGTGMACASCTFSATLHCAVRDTAIVQGLVAQARVLGGVLATATFNVVFSRRLLSHLKEELAVEQIIQIQSDHRALDNLTTLQKFEARRTFASSFAQTVGYCAFCALLGLGVSLFVSNQRTYGLDRKTREVESLLLSFYKNRLRERSL